VAELVDALASGASGLTAVKVRVLSWAPSALAHDSLKCGLFGPLAGARDRSHATNELAETAVAISVTSLPNSAAPISEPGQLPDQQAATETAVDFQPIVVREERKLSSRLCCDQSVPAKLKGKSGRFG
jgi:hypothetical protein